MRQLYTCMRWVLGGVFIYAGATKLADPATFAVIIGAFGLVPDFLVMPAAVLLPAAEVFAGAALMADVRGSLAAVAALLVLFMAILGYGIHMGLDVDCGCFGPEDPESTAFHGLRTALYRDMAMMAAVGFLYGCRRRRGIRPMSPVEGILIARKGVQSMVRRLNWLSLLVMVMTVALTAMPAAAWMNKFEKEVEKEKEAVKLVREVQRGDYDLVTGEELKQWMDAGKPMVIVDTMPYEASYKKAHVPGAVQFLFPIPDMTTWDTKETDGKTQADYEALLGADKEKIIVVYCGFVKCTRSHNGAAWAKKLGYKNVYRYPGGIFGWKGLGYQSEEVK